MRLIWDNYYWRTIVVQVWGGGGARERGGEGEGEGEGEKEGIT